MDRRVVLTVLERDLTVRATQSWCALDAYHADYRRRAGQRPFDRLAWLHFDDRLHYVENWHFVIPSVASLADRRDHQQLKVVLGFCRNRLKEQA